METWLKRLGKYFLIAWIIGMMLFSIFIAVNQKILITRPLDPEITTAQATSSWVYVFPYSNNTREYLNLLVIVVFPIFLFIFSLIYSIKESKKGYLISVVSSLLILAVYIIMFILIGIYDSIFNLFVGKVNLTMLFILLITIGLVVSSFIINSMVYLFRKEKHRR